MLMLGEADIILGSVNLYVSVNLHKLTAIHLIDLSFKIKF